MIGPPLSELLGVEFPHIPWGDMKPLKENVGEGVVGVVGKEAEDGAGSEGEGQKDDDGERSEGEGENADDEEGKEGKGRRLRMGRERMAHRRLNC